MCRSRAPKAPDFAFARRPGLNSDTVFRGEEAETFKVKDGPKMQTGIPGGTSSHPYDETRAGWAAADFLAVVPAP